VHVDRVLVREVDLDETERILVPRKLAELIVVNVLAEPIDLVVGEGIAGGVRRD
jgi:hypothetical protein